jgi:probable phosphoglycerate mutase
MTRVAFLRHADTAWSREGRIQGRSDQPLLDNSFVEVPKAFRGMRIVTSPLKRCMQTAALLGALDAPREPRLVEMDWGDWEGHTLSDLRERLGEAMRDNEARGLDFRPPNGESPREVLLRVKTWLREVNEPTLAVTHRGVIRAVLADATGWDMRGKPPFKLDWSAAHVFVLHNGKPSVERLNVK